MLNTRALIAASALGTVLQVAMVVAGHTAPSVAAMFAVGGMGISLIAGAAYAMWARDARAGSRTLGGLVAGALCALLGIALSWLFGDVPLSLLALGTISSAVTGALGGWLGGFVFRPKVAAAMLVVAVIAPPSAGAQVAVSARNATTTVTTRMMTETMPSRSP